MKSLGAHWCFKSTRLDCLLNRLFRHRSKKTSKLYVTGIEEGNSLVTGEFPAQRASNGQNELDDVIMLVLCTGNPPVMDSPRKVPMTRNCDATLLSTKTSCWTYSQIAADLRHRHPYHGTVLRQKYCYIMNHTCTHLCVTFKCMWLQLCSYGCQRLTHTRFTNKHQQVPSSL